MAHQPFILFITGVSASGKTTLFESLRRDGALAGIRFHDIDENGVPPVGRSAWRKFRVEELLYEAVQELSDHTSTIICGISKPHEIVESRYFKPEFNVHFLLIDVTYTVAARRLSQRIQQQPKTGTFNAEFNPDALAETLLATKNLLRELKHSTLQQKRGHVLDAHELTRRQMHEEALKIIQQL